MKHNKKKPQSSIGRWLEDRDTSAPKSKQARKKNSKPWDKKLNKEHHRYRDDAE